MMEFDWNSVGIVMTARFETTVKNGLNIQNKQQTGAISIRFFTEK